MLGGGSRRHSPQLALQLRLATRTEQQRCRRWHSCWQALLQVTALGPTTVPCSNKDVANGLPGRPPVRAPQPQVNSTRGGITARPCSAQDVAGWDRCLPCAAVAVDDAGFGWFKKKETETAKIVKGDRALADFLSLLFPDDFKIGAVYASKKLQWPRPPRTRPKAREP